MPGITYRKEIIWDRETRDYAMYLDGELTGFARTYHEAEVALDQLIFELMSGRYFAGGSDTSTEPEPTPLSALDAELREQNLRTARELGKGFRNFVV